MKNQSIERERDRRAILQKTKQDIWTIWYSAEHGKVDRIRQLLASNSVNVNTQEPRMQWTPLHFAARYAQEDVMKVLIEYRANVDMRDKDGNSPLHLCAAWGSLRCCVVLLEGGSDTQCMNQDNCTPFDVANKMNHKDIVRLLGSWVPVALTITERKAKEARIASHVSQEDKLLQSEPEPVRLELRSLRSKESMLGLNHPGIIATLCKLAALYRNNNRSSDAIQALRRAISISELHHGVDSLDSATLKNNLAHTLFHFRNESIDYVEECVTLLQTSLQLLSTSSNVSASTDHLTCLENLCICLCHSKQHTIADGYMNELLGIFVETFGPDHEKVLGLQHAIASKYITQKRFHEGIALYDACIRITINKFGRIHRAVAHCYDLLGRAHFLQCCFKEAEDSLRQSLEIMLKLYDASHADIIRGHNNIALVAIAQQSQEAVIKRLGEKQ